jgi:hypothetical protein
MAVLFGTTVVFAWTGPLSTPPSCTSGNPGCDAPVNVGPTDQVKNAGLSVNKFVVFGNTLLGGISGSNAYLNFGGTGGNAGYGLRDNAGQLQYKNSGDPSWSTFGSGASQWVNGTGGAIYYSGGRVGIGVASPTQQLEVNGWVATDGNTGWYNSTWGAGLDMTDATWVRTVNNVGIWTGTGNLGTNGGLTVGYNGTAVTAGNAVFSGQVGIATSNPQAPLEIGNNLGTAGTANQLQLYNNLSGTIYGFGISSGQMNIVAASATDFYNGGTKVLAIGSNGYTTASTGFCIGASCISAWPSAGLSGSGTSGYIPRWTGATALGNSSISSDGVSSTANGNFYVTGQQTIQSTMNINGNQLWNPNATLYLQYNSAAGDGVEIGGGGTQQDLTIAAGNISVNGSIGSSNLSPTAGFPAGWATGLHTYDVYAQGTVGVGPSGGPAVAYISVTGGGSGSFAGNVSAGAFLYNSDERLKKNIEPLTGNLSKVLALQPVSYNWINPALPQTEQIGFIAQQVQKIVPELVYTNASTTMEAVDYARMAPLLVGSVQELSQKIQDQQTQIDTQQQEITELQTEIHTLESAKQ